MSYLGRVVLSEAKGDHQGFVTFDETTRCQLLAFVWCDRDHRCFVSTCSSLANGTTINRMRWRQTDKAPNADPTREQIIVPTLKACETHYSACQKIDQHNRSRQSTLIAEKKVRVTEFDRRINTSVFAIVDT